VVEFVGVGAAAGEGDAFAAIDSVALRDFFQEGVSARFLHAFGNYRLSN
jgi:hypothetical protein